MYINKCIFFSKYIIFEQCIKIQRLAALLGSGFQSWSNLSSDLLSISLVNKIIKTNSETFHINNKRTRTSCFRIIWQGHLEYNQYGGKGCKIESINHTETLYGTSKYFHFNLQIQDGCQLICFITYWWWDVETSVFIYMWIL